jgi:hypothetical protein
MQMLTDHVRWCASDDEQPVLAWCADRSAIAAGWAGRHLAPVAAVGRLPDGRLAVDVLRPYGTPLSAALDTLGTPTTGVAVTLSVPLLELVAAERGGSVGIGPAGLDDVLVDDAGAVVLCDRPPAARPAGGVEDAPSTRTAPAAHTDARRAEQHPDRGASAGRLPPRDRRAGTRSLQDQPGDRTLVMAARAVWERTDPRDPARPAVDAVLAEALDGDLASVRVALALVRATAAPRPVRWDPPSADLLGSFGAPVAAPGDRGGQISAVVRDVVERGLPIGAGRRLPLRRAVVGVVVAAGVTAAAVFALG